MGRQYCLKQVSSAGEDSLRCRYGVGEGQSLEEAHSEDISARVHLEDRKIEVLKM
jgi:hypothetical protein